ncbi:deoxyribodipyrimidine photo-lyase [Sandaracinobacter neustonicus]|uniref:Deoxyribodipyrimidine photo-lyase n=2 Tax=Sandaracinobacter neustonicus TaxID=1715348 RepID=A0A501XGW5_9SPHN|nr:deoxyribodipyrimidine photo-lyase [Sandaracinobacter neustonicus]
MAAPQIIWFRQDLRLRDQAALLAAAAAGPVLPLFVLDESRIVRAAGGASRWWLHHSLAALDASLRALGGGLLLLRGPAAELIPKLVADTGADAVHAIRLSEPWWPLIEREIPRLQLHEGNSLVPAGLLRTKAGDRFRVFTPFWRAMQGWGPPPRPLPAPARLTFAPLPAGDRLVDWSLLPRAPDWSGGFSGWQPGEAGAQRRLADFLDKAGDYGERRNYPGEEATSRLSPHLHFGEISPADAWHAVEPQKGSAPWLRQLAWRDFALETLEQYPKSASRPHRPEFAHMPWTDVSSGEGRALLRAWQRGRTGYPLVDAGMRQLWASGWMHNRVRMVAASFLVKHLMIDWREGERWFWDTLLDADLANNAMGWQWVTGSGVDSAPYYRIFSPEGQAEKFDAQAYIRHWVPEFGRSDYPAPLVEHRLARERALAAHAALKG